MQSCFEDLDSRNMMLQSEFNLDISSEIYGFFLFQLCLQVDDVIVLSYLHAYICLFSLYTQTVIFIKLKCDPPHIQLDLQAMVGYAFKCGGCSRQRGGNGFEASRRPGNLGLEGHRPRHCWARLCFIWRHGPRPGTDRRLHLKTRCDHMWNL